MIIMNRIRYPLRIPPLLLIPPSGAYIFSPPLAISSKHRPMLSLTISAFTHIWLAHNRSNIRPNGTDRTHTILCILLSHLLLYNIYSQRYRDVVISESFENKGLFRRRCHYMLDIICELLCIPVFVLLIVMILLVV